MPNFVFLDTETDGLHIITSRPFSFQFAHLKDSPVYLPATANNLKKIITELSKPDTWLIGHNIKFDCHMLINIGVPITLFKKILLVDTMFMARLAINHEDQIGNVKFRIPPMSLALKKLAEKYLGADSREEELQVKEAFKKLKVKHKLDFKMFLLGFLGRNPTTEELNNYYNITEADIVASNFMYNTDLIKGVQEWLIRNPYPTYKDIPEYIMKPYATKDIILTKGLFLKFLDAIKSKDQMKIFIRESRALYPLLLMEREGLVIDKETTKEKYKELFELRKKLNVIIAPVTILKATAEPIAIYETITEPKSSANKIIEDKVMGKFIEYKKSDIIMLEGEQVNTKSPIQMAALYSYETKLIITKADKTTRESIMDISPSARKIQTLRPLDKLIDTYLYRLINEPILINGEWRLYGTYNNLETTYDESGDTTGTVTSRLSSDLQQFPKEPLKDADDNEIINIRRLFIKPKDAYAMMYFDMSQLELKLQTIWSAIIDKTPDIVMARGFGPYHCHEQFKDGKSIGWFLNESPTIKWEPTDFHSATAYEAFHMQPDYEKNKAHYRSLGKRANFA